MTAVPTPFISRITKHLHWIEKFCLVCLAVSAILILIEVDASSLIMLSMSTLAVVYFLNAYSVTSVETTDDEKEQGSFSELLALHIIPKVLWISASISTIGILFYFLHLKGFKELLMIGGGSLFVGLGLLGVFAISGTKHLNVLMAVITRAIPLLVIDIYLFFK